MDTARKLAEPITVQNVYDVGIGPAGSTYSKYTRPFARGGGRVWAPSSLATSPSLPGRSSGRAAKPRAEGGEGLANIALDHVSLDCQLHVPVNR